MHTEERPTAKREMLRSLTGKREALRSWRLTLLAALAVLALHGAASAQWTTPDANNNISNTNSGNVGIGTGADAPTGKLEVRQIGNSGLYATFITSFGASEDTFIRGGSSSATIHIGDLTATTSKLLLMENGGNVGVGTASPGALLDVSRAATSSNDELIGIRANGFTQTVTQGMTNARFNQFNQPTINSDTGQNVANAATLFVQGAPLVSGSASITNNYSFWVGDGPVRFDLSGVGRGAADGLILQSTSAGFQNSPRLRFSGKGIGRPGTPLDFTVRLVTGMDATDTYLDFSYAYQGFTYGAYPGTYFNAMAINMHGDVGVGTTAPIAKLDVAGQVRSSSGGFVFPDNSVQQTASFGTITGVTAGTGLGGGGTSGSVTLTNTDPGSSQNIFKNVANAAGAAQFSAASNNDTIRFEGTGGTAVSFDPGNKKVTINTAAPVSSGWTDAGSSVSLTSASANVGIGTSSPAGKVDIAGNVSAPSWTTAGVQLQAEPATYTDTTSAASSNIATRVADSFAQPAFASSNPVTVGDAATLYVAGAPAAGANTTITRAHALQVAAGDAVFGGNVGVGTTSPGVKLDVNGQVRSNSGGFVFPDATTQTTASFGTVTGVNAGAGLSGGGTSGSVTLNVAAGAGITANAGGVSVNYGSAPGTAVQGNTTLTVAAGTGMSGGGTATLGSGGTITLNNVDTGSSQNIFKSVANAAGAAQFSAASNNDSIRFEGTGGTTLSFDPNAKKVTINSAAAASSGWTDAGSSVSLTSASASVGVGITSPAAKLHVDVNSASAGTDSLSVANRGVNSMGQTTGLRFQFNTAVPAAIRARLADLTSGSASLSFFTSADGTAASLAERMTISPAGNVGVGTAGPTERLHVQGGVSVQGGAVGTTGNVLIHSDGTLGPYLASNTDSSGNSTVGAAAMRLQVGGNGLIISSSPSTAAGSARTFTQRHIFDTSGNVGIGTTSPVFDANPARYMLADGGAGSWFEVGAGGNTTNPAYTVGQFSFVNTGLGGAEKRVATIIGSTNGAINTGRVDFYVANAGSFTVPTMSVTSGSVGVGTTGPTYPLDVVSGSQWAARFKKTDATHGGIIVEAAANYNPNVALSSGGVVKWYISSNAGGGDVLQFWEGTGAHPRLTITQDGHVGIGTTATNPAHTLEVAGTINASEAITGATINAVYQDVAEWVPSSQKLQAGTVVVLDTTQTNHVLASTKPYDTGVAGVVSASPGVILGQGGTDKVKVATTGRVKVRADATRAPIHVGDLLVTSGVEGVAMKSIPVDLGGTPIHRPGTIIGKALEPLEKGTGEILVLLSLQ